jgi:protein SCO1
MSKKSILYILFFILLVFGFYTAMSVIIPGFGKKSFPPLSTVEAFSFTNQDGKRVTEKDVAGKVYVAEFFFTTCTGICPVMNNNMRKVYDKFKTEKDFLILSHTCDPETDSVPRMKRYADSMNVNTAQWIFLTGRKDSLYNMARTGYKIDDPKNNFGGIKDQFLHSQFFALVNRKGEVKKVYDGLKKNEINNLMTDIEELLLEK